ncbi:MAG: uroporphyrinogen-III C-methyltransferase [Maricaulaceae bacterium]|jgi:uroporphyrin-III C-methyltransferase
MPPETTSQQTGRVSLVGAGPGDPDLLTVRALRTIEAAEALLFDALVSQEIIALAPARCTRICVGKRGDKLAVPQEKTNALMVRLARRGLHVVRLKGGDPSVFGRVEEERAYLEARGVPFETVPGVTAASAAAAQFSFPLTHRGEARRVVYLTARGMAGTDEVLASPSLADVEATLVFYMASHVAAAVEVALLAAGRDPTTPVAIVENAGSPAAKLSLTRIDQLADAVDCAEIAGPALIAVGDAVAHARLGAVEAVVANDQDQRRA